MTITRRQVVWMLRIAVAGGGIDFDGLVWIYESCEPAPTAMTWREFLGLPADCQLVEEM